MVVECQKLRRLLVSGPGTHGMLMRAVSRWMLVQHRAFSLYASAAHHCVACRQVQTIAVQSGRTFRLCKTLHALVPIVPIDPIVLRHIHI